MQGPCLLWQWTLHKRSHPALHSTGRSVPRTAELWSAFPFCCRRADSTLPGDSVEMGGGGGRALLKNLLEPWMAGVGGDHLKVHDHSVLVKNRTWQKKKIYEEWEGKVGPIHNKKKRFSNTKYEVRRCLLFQRKPSKNQTHRLRWSFLWLKSSLKWSSGLHESLKDLRRGWHAYARKTKRGLHIRYWFQWGRGNAKNSIRMKHSHNRSLWAKRSCRCWPQWSKPHAGKAVWLEPWYIK